MRMLIPTALALLAVACAGGEGEQPIPDDQIGLSKVAVTEVPAPPPVVDNASEPGELPVRARAYEGAPPVVPHGVADFLPITRDENMCVACHGVDEKVEGGPTPIPASHYVDLRNAPGQVRDEIAGARNNCVACHAPQTDAAPLVVNEFGS